MEKIRLRNGKQMISYELQFTTRARYCRAVRYLMASDKYTFSIRGRDSDGKWYVCFYKEVHA